MNSMDEEKLTDHDLLMKVYTRQEHLIKDFENHLKHHFAITIAALTAAFMGTGSLVVGIILLLARTGLKVG